MMEKHISILGALYIAFGVYNLFIGLMGLLAFLGFGIFSADQNVLGILFMLGYFLFFYFLILAVPSLIAGFGLLKKKEWARIICLVLGFLSLLNVPLGTALGIYTIWALIQPETIELFSHKQDKWSAPIQ